MNQGKISEEKNPTTCKVKNTEYAKHYSRSADENASAITGLQQQLGNHTVQRLLTQRSETGSFDLDDETAGRIHRERGGGQSLEAFIQKQAGTAIGCDFGGVRVHTSSEANDLSRQLGAKAFTTGQDVFFRDGAYEPHTSSGQELIAHELTHVVQQSTGAVGGSGGRMKVNAPGDAFEQEADAVAKAITSPDGTQVQCQVKEEDEPVQMQELEEEEGETLQMQELEEEEDLSE